MRKRENAQPLPAPGKERANRKDANTAGAQMSEAELRVSLMRSFTMVMNRWRECPVRVCRRARRCAGANFECTKLPPRRPRKPENDAAVMAHVQKVLKRRLAEMGQAYVPPKLRKPPAGGR
jgi:hypothetical protein